MQLGLGEHERGVDGVRAAQARGMRDDRRDAVRPPELLEEERDAHESLSYERVRRADLPFALPAAGAPARVAFVGPAVPFEHVALTRPAGGLQPAFLDPVDAPGLVAFDPEAIVAFGADAVAALDGRPVPVLAVLEAAGPAPAGADRVVSPDPFGWDAARGWPPPWRCVALPIADELYRRPMTAQGPPRPILAGPPPADPDPALARVLADFAPAPVLDGAPGADADVAIHLAGGGASSYSPLAALHLAAGRLLLAQRIDPGFGLRPGTDYVEVRDADELDLRLHQLTQRPETYDRIRLQGHRTSRRLRASLVWPRLLGDLFRDLAAFGTQRTVGVS
jgi:hypothetical protein